MFPACQATLQAQLRAQEVDMESMRQLAAWQDTARMDGLAQDRSDVFCDLRNAFTTEQFHYVPSHAFAWIDRI